jgi:hypothetical protein
MPDSSRDDAAVTVVVNFDIVTVWVGSKTVYDHVNYNVYADGVNSFRRGRTIQEITRRSYRSTPSD